MPTSARDSARSLTPPRGAAVAGVIFAVLMSVGLVIIRVSVPASRADSGDWLNDPGRLKAFRFAVHLAPFAGIAFLWFIGVLRNRLGPLEDRFFASVFLGSGLLFVASLYASAAFAGAMVETMATDTTRFLESGLYHLARNLVGAFLNVFAIKMAGVFIISTSTIGLRTAIFPRWVAFVGYPFALVLLLIITSWPWVALLFPLWMLLVSTTILLAEYRPGDRDSLPEAR